MKRKGLIIFGSILVLFIVVIFALPFVVDVNHFRLQIEAQMQQALGRPVQIGEMHLSILAGGASASNISIGEDPAFGQQPFLQAKSLDVGVQLLPLIMSHTLHVTGLTLREPQVRLVRGPGGRWNFSSLGTGAAANAPAASNPRGRRNQRAAQAAPRSAAPQSNAAAASAENFSIDSLKIADGRVIVASTANPRSHTYDSVNLKAENISYTGEMPFTLDTKTPGGGSIHVEGNAGPINRENAAQTPLDAKISVKHLDLATTGFVDPASGLAGII